MIMNELVKKAEDLLIEVKRVLAEEKDRGNIELLEDFEEDLRAFIKYAKNDPIEYVTEDGYTLQVHDDNTICLKTDESETGIWGRVKEDGTVTGNRNETEWELKTAWIEYRNSDCEKRRSYKERKG